jgi:hypothetical protein
MRSYLKKKKKSHKRAGGVWALSSNPSTEKRKKKGEILSEG